MKRNFKEDIAFLKRHGVAAAILANASGARAAVVPAWQGRVLTSAVGDTGSGFGWLNDALIAAGKRTPRINAYGGEERFWLGPEGGEFALYFPPGAPFDFEAWQVPPCFDTLPWQVTAQSAATVALDGKFELINRHGSIKKIGLSRKVTLLEPEEIAGEFGPEAAGFGAVAYRSDNTLTNVGDEPWTHDNGGLSIWMLGMFVPSESCEILIPFRRDGDGPAVRDDYFGGIGADRLRIDDAAGWIRFKADGRSRGKIGLSRFRAGRRLGSFDPDRGTLTVLQYRFDPAATEYVNSAWAISDKPWEGDVINAYNDGPTGGGATQMGPFYELESSSPAAFLPPGGKITHSQMTLHLTGDAAKLAAAAGQLLRFEG